MKTFTLVVVNIEWLVILSQKNTCPYDSVSRRIGYLVVYEQWYPLCMNRQRNECHLGTVKPYEQKTRGKIDPQSPESESLTFAGSSVCYGSCHVSVKALLAVVAVAACSVVAAVHADPSALSPRQLIQLHVESAATGMEVAVTRCRGKVNIFSCGIASANVSRKKSL